MGGKRTGSGKYIYICIALMTALSISGCTSLSTSLKSMGAQDECRKHLLEARQHFAKGAYAASMEENRKALGLPDGNCAKDEAVFGLGLAYVHSGRTGKNYGEAVNWFRRLTKEHPNSPRSAEARVWVEVLEENERLRRAAVEANQENVKLKGVIQRSKKVDVEIEGMKRENVR